MRTKQAEPNPDAARRAAAVTVGAGLFAGFVMLAVCNAIAITLWVPLPKAGVSLRLAHLLFDASETMGLGAMVALSAGAFVGFARLPRWAFEVLAFVAAVAVVKRVAGDYLELSAAHALDGRFATPMYILWLGFYGVVLTVAPTLTFEWQSRRRLRFLPLMVAVLLLSANQLALRDDYMDLHGVFALFAVLLGGAALAEAADKLVRRLVGSLWGRLAFGAIGLVALFGIFVPPPNQTRFELFRQPTAIASWVFATTLWRAPSLHRAVTPPPSRWLEDRSNAQPIKPTVPALLPPNAIVVLITIDALRAEAVNDATNDARFPTLAKLKHEGVVFTHASAPGTQTGVSLSTMYSGLYYSERPWENYGVGKNRHPYPASSSAPHFPELLAEHGVATANFASLPFLGGDYGVTGHFADEKDLGQSTAGALGPMLVANMVERLRHADEAPLFLVTHLLEPHAPPFTLIHDRSAEYARYLSQIAAADRAMSRLLPLLEQRFGDRWAVLVSADHGEAFDEHGTYDHSKTLYEELLHVPLLAMSPHFSARTIEAPVGLIDLGPTILDLFGVDTPATFNGQSLVPLLAGGAEALTRPLLAEGRLRRAITEPDGLKVIEDLRRKVVEVYDLKVDPGETENLFDREPDRADAALAELRAFFAVHAYTKDGYEPRYKL